MRNVAGGGSQRAHSAWLESWEAEAEVSAQSHSHPRAPRSPQALGKLHQQLFLCNTYEVETRH